MPEKKYNAIIYADADDADLKKILRHIK